MTTQIKYTDDQFTSVQFMTATEKRLLARAWQRFINANMSYEQFAKRVYNHLSLHCDHIAHYDINGFYHEWFADPVRRRQSADEAWP